MKNLAGKRFGRLLAKNPVGKNSTGHILWKCRCDCGKRKIVPGYVLTKGSSKSCGCLASEISRKRMKKHGKFGTKIYSIWSGMIGRCANKNGKDYYKYGGRGIKVCDRWKDFRLFYEDMGEPPERHSLGRKNNELGYSKDNCRWESFYEQNNNRRNNVFLVHENGDVKTIAEWARCLGINASMLYSRARNNTRMGFGLKKTFS